MYVYTLVVTSTKVRTPYKYAMLFSNPPSPHHCIVHSAQVLVVDGHHTLLLPCSLTQPDGFFIALCSFFKLLLPVELISL